MEPLFDRRVLDLLNEQAAGLGGADLVIEVADEALTSIVACVADVEAAASARDLLRLGAAAHRVKSVLRQVGALRMGERAAEIESHAKHESAEAFTVVPVFVGLRDETVAELRAYVAELRG